MINQLKEQKWCKKVAWRKVPQKKVLLKKVPWKKVAWKRVKEIIKFNGEELYPKNENNDENERTKKN